MQKMIVDLWTGVQALTVQLKEEGMVPEWRPDDRLKEYCEELAKSNGQEKPE